VSFLVLFAVTAAVTAAFAVRRNERQRREAAAATVELLADRDRVARTLADGRYEEVLWSEVEEVEVITTAVGLHRDDGVVLVIAGPGERGCLVPSQLAVEHGVIELLHALPGFDSRRLVAAMEQPPPARTTCWARDDR
jgi:hypothetical protein